MHKSQKFFLFGCVFLFGVFIRSFFEISPFIVLAISIFFIRKRIIFIALIFLCIGIFRFDISMPIMNASFISYFAEKQITFEGVISDEPDERHDHTKLTISITKITKPIVNELSGKILVKTPRFPHYNYGDKLSVSCKIRLPGIIDKTFDYGKYLSRFNIYATCYNPKVYRLSSGHGNFVKAKILEFKKYISRVLNTLLHEPQSSFLAGILLGSRKGIDPELIEAFNRTGTTHIIAVSGYNITIVARVILVFLQSIYIGRRYAFWFAVIGIFSFTIMTGASAAVVRSAIMGCIVLYVQKSGRQSTIHNILLLTGLGMVIYNPKILIFDIGFQLSFFATIGLIYLNPYIEPFCKWMPKRFSLRESLSTTLSATFATLPIIVYNFGRFSIISPVVNLLILPAIPLSMLLGFIALCIGFFSQFLGQIFALLVWCSLSYIIFVIKVFSKIPFAVIDI